MDPRVVVRAQQGDKAAFRVIVETSSGRLKQVAYRIVRDSSLADDAVQHALIAIWQSLPRLKDPLRFDAWSYRFVVRACYREAKRARRALPDHGEAQAPMSRDGLSVIHDREQLEKGFARLSLDHRAVVVLHYYLDLTMEDTAEALGISVGTAKSRLNRAMAKLRLALHADAPDSLQPDREPAR